MTSKIVPFPKKARGFWTTVALLVGLPVLWALIAVAVIFAAVFLWPVATVLSVGDVLDNYFEV